MAKKWYVVHTYSGYEKKVKENLEQSIRTLGLEDRISRIEIPEEEVVEIKEGGKRKETKPKLFPGYVLVKMEMDDYVRVVVRNTQGVTGFVGSQGNPEPLTREEFNKIMRRSSKGTSTKRTTTSIEVGDAIRVTSGPLEGFDGMVSEVSPKEDKVKVLVSIFGRETPVELTFDQISNAE